ncbi:MAG: UDP-2,3-diacylglucosamine diphosphatase [Deltaproteobacteria bacterium]|nr:UDP-2,3-diacylglucosamine diphosphatase [Deltaproteobacteria bacterium]MBI3293816.1 UDP-2,3-diacylglucosamine diphosphatase [Deltaproteobacteria bacterium]
MNAIFLSDVHLQDSSSVKARLVIRFLDEVVSRYSHLFILGDLFDVWPGTDGHLAKKFRPVLSSLRNLTERGCEIHYIEGNHDFCLGPFFRESLGIQVHEKQFLGNLGGHRVLMLHGDLGNPKQHSYRVLRKVLRSAPVQLFRRMIPGQMVFDIGRKTSRMSREYQGPINERRESTIREIYRDSARQLWAEGFDTVIMGHTHIPDEMISIVANRTRRYFNLGDWVKNFTYLEFDGINFYTKRHPVVAQ